MEWVTQGTDWWWARVNAVNEPSSYIEVGQLLGCVKTC